MHSSVIVLGTAFYFILGLRGSETVSFEQDLTLTAKQKAILDVFKERVVDIMPHDYMKKDIYLIRWLKVRDFDLGEAEKMLMENLRWREEQRMDTIQDEDWSAYQRDYKYWLEGRDKQGRPILFFDLGTQDIRRAVLGGHAQRYSRYVDKILDEAMNLVRELGEKYGNVTRAQLVADLDGFNLAQHSCLQCVPVIIRMITSYEAHFPMGADQLLLLNTPTIFEPLLQALKQVAHPETKRALRIYGRNRARWQEAMSKDFDFDQLPPVLGGTKLYKGMDEY